LFAKTNAPQDAIRPELSTKKRPVNIAISRSADVRYWHKADIAAFAEDAMGYTRWYLEHMFAIAPAGAFVGQWLQSFREFPPRRKPGSFNLDRVMEAVTRGASDK